MSMERTASKESVMNRLGLCVVIIAALSAISFPVRALMLGLAPGVDAIPTDIKDPSTLPDPRYLLRASRSASSRIRWAIRRATSPQRGRRCLRGSLRT
jgi:hypothetical protein